MRTATPPPPISPEEKECDEGLQVLKNKLMKIPARKREDLLDKFTIVTSNVIKQLDNPSAPQSVSVVSGLQQPQQSAYQFQMPGFQSRGYQHSVPLPYRQTVSQPLVDPFPQSQAGNLMNLLASDTQPVNTPPVNPQHLNPQHVSPPHVNPPPPPTPQPAISTTINLEDDLFTTFATNIPIIASAASTSDTNLPPVSATTSATVTTSTVTTDSYLLN